MLSFKIPMKGTKMRKALGIVAGLLLVATTTIGITQQASAATGACGPFGAHYATDVPNGGTNCYQIRAKMTATDTLAKTSTLYYGAWVNVGATSTSFASGPSSFSSYTTLSDTWEGRSDV